MNDTISKTKIGILGFFDILGYSSFLENNTPEAAATIVLNQLVKIKERISDLHKYVLPTDDLREAYRQVLDPMEWLIFSDTILLALPYGDDTTDDRKKAFAWVAFLANSIMLYRHMFDTGLPLRGAVSFGSFFIKETCFAGRPIIEAYRTSHKIELSGTILAPSAISELSKINAESHFKVIRMLTAEYLVPLKDQKNDRLPVLLPSLVKLPKVSTSDLRQLVAESFWRHNKDLSTDDLGKLINTELLFRFFHMRSPKIFGSEETPSKDEK